MAQSPCGISAALDEAKAGIDSLKDKIKGGLDSIGDLGGLADTIKNKLSEVNIPQTPKINLQEELAKLPMLSPNEYLAKVNELKQQFGSSLSNLDDIINKIPKPAGLDATGEKNIFGELQKALGNAGAAFQNVQDLISQTNISDVVSSICEDVPNIEAPTTTDPSGNVIVLPPVEKAPAPITPSANAKEEPKPSEPPAGGFTFKFTKEKLIAAAGPKAADWYDAMTTVLPKYNITTPERVAAFLGNCRTETNWTTLEENLNYGAKYLFDNLNPGRKRFPTYEDALKVERKPEPIANIIYMIGRKLLDPQPGDGWKYRGRGLIQLTFKDNYLKASKAIYGDDRLVKNPDTVAKDKSTAIDTAAWYFKCTNINSWADKKDWGNCRSITNAGRPGVDPSKIHGYAEAVKNQENAYKALIG